MSIAYFDKDQNLTEERFHQKGAGWT